MKRMKKRTAGLLCGLLVLALVGCGAQTSEPEVNGGYKYKTESAGTANVIAAEDALFDSAASAAERPMDAQTGGGVYQNSGVKLIRRADLQIQTVDFDTSVASLETVVAGMGGYFERVELYGGNYFNQGSNRSGRYVVRIPAAAYDTFMNQVGGLGYVSHRNESTQDVGKEYFDTESRLATKRAKRERLQELLKRADSVEDIIAIESELSEVDYEIDQLESGLRGYDSLIGFATIEVSIQEMQRITDDPGQQAGLFQRMKIGFFSSAGRLVDGARNLLVWVSYNAFGLLLTAAVALCGVVVGRKYFRARKEKKAAKEEETP